MRKATKRLAETFAPKVTDLAPDLTSAFVHEALDRALAGVGPLASASEAAEKHLRDNDGNVDKAIKDVREAHLRMAAVEGFVTNLGGLATMTVSVPSNIVGLALIHCRMVAQILHLRGYDLATAQARDAIVACLLGEDTIEKQVRKGKLPGTPAEIVMSSSPDPVPDRQLAADVASELITRVIGKRMAVMVAKRTPVVGGMVGASTDAWVTWKLGRYADREFLPRNRR